LKKSFFLNLDFEFLFPKTLINTLIVFKRERPEFKEKIELILELIEYGYANLNELKHAQNFKFNYSPHLLADVLADKRQPPTLIELKQELFDLIGYYDLSSAFHLNRTEKIKDGFAVDSGSVDYVTPSLFGYKKETISTSLLRSNFTRAFFRVKEEQDKKLIQILGYCSDRAFTSPSLISDFMNTVKFFWANENADYVMGKIAEGKDSQFASLGKNTNSCRFRKSNFSFKNVSLNKLALVYQKIGGIFYQDDRDLENIRVIFTRDKEAAKKEWGEHVFQNMNPRINLYK